MKITIAGTGIVGRTIAAGFASKGHDIRVGTRDVDALMARTEADAMGNGPFAHWKTDHPEIDVTTLAEALTHGELIVNATAGHASMEALSGAGPDALAGRIVADASNPIAPDSGWPPSLFVANTDSLGEQLQAAFPDARFVKVWNTMTASLMCNPEAVAGGDHSIPVCGNDADAKAEVTSLLRAFGWNDVVDLGGIDAARAMEAYLLIWLRGMTAFDSAMFNTKFVR